VLHADENISRLESDLRKAVLTGALEPSTRLMSVRTLAQQYNVTYGKTLRALKKLEKQGLLVSRHGGGTFVADVLPPMAGATGNVLRQTSPAALLVAPRHYWNLGEGVWLNEFIRGFETRLRALGASFDILATEDYLQQPGPRADAPQVHVLFGTPELIRGLEHIRSSGSYILVGSEVAHSSWAMVMEIDGERGIRTATQHLLESNHRKIVLFSWDMFEDLSTFRWWVTERERAFEKAVMAAGLKPFILRVPHPAVAGEHPERVDRIKELLRDYFTSGTGKHTGIVCVNDLLAQYVLNACAAHGVKVPEDVSVIGFDDEPWTVTAGLSTLSRPYRELGSIAADLAVQQRSVSRRFRGAVLLEPVLVRRNSVKCL